MNPVNLNKVCVFHHSRFVCVPSYLKKYVHYRQDFHKRDLLHNFVESEELVLLTQCFLRELRRLDAGKPESANDIYQLYCEQHPNAEVCKIRFD